MKCNLRVNWTQLNLGEVTGDRCSDALASNKNMMYLEYVLKYFWVWHPPFAHWNLFMPPNFNPIFWLPSEPKLCDSRRPLNPVNQPNLGVYVHPSNSYPSIHNVYIRSIPPNQDASHHQDDITFLVIPGIPINLRKCYWMGVRSNAYSILN